MTCDSGIHEKVGEPFRTFMRQNNGPGSQQNFRTQLHAPVFSSKKEPINSYDLDTSKGHWWFQVPP